jgi:hypothetical protein
VKSAPRLGRGTGGSPCDTPGCHPWFTVGFSNSY